MLCLHFIVADDLKCSSTPLTTATTVLKKDITQGG